MSLFRKSPFSRTSRSSDESSNAADQLRSEISALESEMRESMRALADVQATAAAAEARVMEAIRAGDDRAARASLLEQQAHTEKAAVIAADTHVLRAILDECYQFAGKAAHSSVTES
jgi:ElaB/YqjD/DUF883 family membrane-anchored ribosome-binding protein